MISENTKQVIPMELPKRKPNRLTEYDYSTPNAYFIAICTANRKNLFWKDARAGIDLPENIPLTNLGMAVKQIIYDIPKHYPTITVDHAVVMPNHIHLLLQINTDADGRPMAAPTISTVINQTKGIVSKKQVFLFGKRVFMIMSSGASRIIWMFGIILKGIPVNGQKIRYLFLTAGKRDDIGLDKTKVLRPSSRAQAGVHRTPAFKLFESYI